MNPFLRSTLLGATLTLASPVLLAQVNHRLSPEHLAGHWILLNTQVSAEVPNSGRNMDKPGCVAVSYTIGSDGVPRDVTVRKVAPPSDLGPVAASAVANFRYGPSLTNRSSDPIDTYYIVPFNTPADPVAKQKLIDACRLPGYAD